MSILTQISEPSDLRQLNSEELSQLAEEIRRTLIDTVSKTGGHLGPNLGVVELTIALHRVFDSPKDAIIFDTGHQSYVHKLLTGRQKQFSTLRQSHGLSGYPSRSESIHDIVESSHASASLSWAYGIANGKRITKALGHVVAVIGDGALTGGMSWEALNNISVKPELPLVIVVNDNGRSYTPTVGGLATYLNGLRTDQRYEKTLSRIKNHIKNKPVGGLVYALLHAVKSGLKDALAPQGMFSDLGIKYLGPFDGHSIESLERALNQAKTFNGPVIVHCVTTKGKGYQAAEEHEADKFHAIGTIDVTTGLPVKPAARTFTDVVRQELVEIGEHREDIVAISAAMMHPTGLDAFAKRFPLRTFDVGIAEAHAITTAAGLAYTGLHPVVAIYSTFLSRAFDQLLFDVGLHKARVTLLLDRAGITGPDGASHHGIWDISVLNNVPGIKIAAPWDESSLKLSLAQAIDVNGLSVVRYSKDPLPLNLEALAEISGLAFWHKPETSVIVLGIGAMAQVAKAVATELNIAAASPLWLETNNELISTLANYQQIFTIEDGVLPGGYGVQLKAKLPQTQCFGISPQYLRHASRSEILAEQGLDVTSLVTEIKSKLD